MRPGAAAAAAAARLRARESPMCLSEAPPRGIKALLRKSSRLPTNFSSPPRARPAWADRRRASPRLLRAQHHVPRAWSFWAVEKRSALDDPVAQKRRLWRCAGGLNWLQRCTERAARTDLSPGPWESRARRADARFRTLEPEVSREEMDAGTARGARRKSSSMQIVRSKSVWTPEVSALGPAKAPRRAAWALETPGVVSMAGRHCSPRRANLSGRSAALPTGVPVGSGPAPARARLRE